MNGIKRFKFPGMKEGCNAQLRKYNQPYGDSVVRRRRVAGLLMAITSVGMTGVCP